MCSIPVDQSLSLRTRELRQPETVDDPAWDSSGSRGGNRFSPDDSGRYVVSMEELGRIEFATWSKPAVYLMVNGERHRLPLGSSLKNGVFHWQAGRRVFGTIRAFVRAGGRRHGGSLGDHHAEELPVVAADIGLQCGDKHRDKSRCGSLKDVAEKTPRPTAPYGRGSVCCCKRLVPILSRDRRKRVFRVFQRLKARATGFDSPVECGRLSRQVCPAVSFELVVSTAIGTNCGHRG